MGIGLKKNLLSIFLDFITDGERVVTQREWGETEEGRRYVKKKSKVIEETGEVLEILHYSPNSRKPFLRHVYRSYLLN
jgi:hypothetical protein